MKTSRQQTRFLSLMGLFALIGLIYVFLARGRVDVVTAERDEDIRRSDQTEIDLRERAASATAARRVLSLAKSVTFHVADVGGKSISGAEILLSTGERGSSRESTNSKGEALVTGLRPGITFRVQHLGYATKSGVINDAAADLVEITLVESFVIEGTVRLADGSVPSFPCDVYAWPGRLGLKPGAIARREVMRVPVSRTGDFTLQGVAKKQVYSLQAGAKGWCTRTCVFARSGQKTMLELWKVLGARIQIFDSEGGFLPRSSFGRFSVDVSPQAGSLAIPRGAPETQLAGIEWVDDVRARSHLGLADQILLYKVATPGSNLDHVDITFDVPGFRRRQLRVGVHPVLDTLAAYTARLERTVGGHADIRYECVGFSFPKTRLSIRSNTLHSLVFQPTRKSDQILMTELHSWPSGIIHGVPYGEYDVLLVRTHLRTRTKIGRVTVGREPLVLKLPFEHTGGLRFRFLRPEQTTQPLLYVRMDWQGLGQRKGVRFRLSYSKAPYLVLGIAPGEYDVKLSDAFGHWSLNHVEIQGGTTRAMTVQWPNQVESK